MSSEELSFADKQKIDEVCDQFEAAWKSGESPALEEFANLLPARLRIAVLTELVVLDSFYRATSLADENGPRR